MRSGRVWILIMAALMMPAAAMATDKGVIGALIGAGAGAAIGHAVDPTGGSGKGAIIGGIGGYLIGSQMNDSEASVPPPEQRTVHEIPENCDHAYDLLKSANNTSARERKVYVLQQAVRWCPGSPRLHNDLGVAYYHRGKHFDRKRAREELKYALKLDPDYTTAKKNLKQIK